MASVDGWHLVTAIENEFKVGDLVIYMEPDSWVPTEIAAFLTKPGHFPKEYKGVKGERLKTIKLRGQISQGLILPLEDYAGQPAVYPPGSGETVAVSEVRMVEEGDDLTEFFGILKWEKDVPANMRGTASGNFPSFIRKTDQERVQNLTRSYQQWYDEGSFWESTEKLDGSSMTVYVNDFKIGFCSRNWDLKPDPANVFGQMMQKLVEKNKIDDKLFYLGWNLAFQGELIGPGIQGNKYNLSEISWYVFDVWDIDKQEYLSPMKRHELVADLGLLHVPVVSSRDQLKWATIDEVLTYADGPSTLNQKVLREGVVFKSHDRAGESFKCISNKWLIRHDG